MKRIIIDTDGVIRDFHQKLIEVYKKYYPQNGAPTLQKITSWELKNHFPIGEKIHQFYAQDHTTEIFYDAPIKEGAIDFLKNLKKEFFIILATSQGSLDCKAITMQWYLKHNLPHDEIVFTVDKSMINGDYLIDDSPEQLEHAMQKGIKIIPFLQPWNINWCKKLDQEKNNNFLNGLWNKLLNISDSEKFEAIYQFLRSD